MATEASLTDQTADKHVEEMKVDDVKHVDEQSVSQPKDLEKKYEEEKLKAEDSTSVEPSVTEQEEKPEDKKNDDLAEEVEKEAAEAGKVIVKEPDSELEEKPAENMVVCLVQESEAGATKEPTVLETVKETEEKATESVISTVTLVQDSEVEATKEAAISEIVKEEVKTKELPSASETEEKATESVISTVAESPSDATGTSNAETSQDEKVLAEFEMNPESSKEEPSSIEVSIQAIEAISVDPAEVSELKDAGAIVPEVPDVPKKTDAETNTFGAVEESVKAESGVPEMTEVNPNADGGAQGSVKEESGVPEMTEFNPNADGGAQGSVKEESGVGETEVLKESAEVGQKEEKDEEGEEPTLSETTKTDAATEVEVSNKGEGFEKAEEKAESLEGDKTSLVEASKDLDAATEAAEISTEGEKASGAVEVVEKDASLEGDKTTLVETSRDIDADLTVKETVDSKAAELELKPAEAIEAVTDKLVNDDSETKGNDKAGDAKDGGDTNTEGEAPKQDIPTKPIQRQSNNIISKVKQSIVKVKKAIIGKSPSSKSMPTEGKDEIKVK